MSALESPIDSHSTLSTQLIKPNFPSCAVSQFLYKLTLFIVFCIIQSLGKFEIVSITLCVPTALGERKILKSQNLRCNECATF